VLANPKGFYYFRDSNFVLRFGWGVSPNKRTANAAFTIAGEKLERTTKQTQTS